MSNESELEYLRVLATEVSEIRRGVVFICVVQSLLVLSGAVGWLVLWYNW